MKERDLTVAEVSVIAATRVALGAGIGLLLAGHLSPPARRATGTALLIVGVVTTPPLLAHVLNQ